MKILAFGATSSSKSINKKLAAYAASLVPQAEIDLLDLNEFEMPLFSQDKEEAIGQPQLAKDFLYRIEQADAVIISFAEHNGSYTVAYKNVFDWASRINTKVFQKKPMIMLSTSPGPGGAASVLASAVNSAPYFDGEVIGSLSVPSFFDNFNSEENKLSSDEMNEKLKRLIDKLTQI